MSDEKVPMQSDGRGSPVMRGDGVGEPASHGRSPSGESGGGSYENPHSGKQARGEGGKFDGGQTDKHYFGPGQLDGEKADDDKSGVTGQGG